MTRACHSALHLGKTVDPMARRTAGERGRGDEQDGRRSSVTNDGGSAERETIRLELGAARQTFHELLSAAEPEDLARPSDGTRWTNRQLLFHMLFGYLVVRALAPLVKVVSRRSHTFGRKFAAALNAVTGPFNVINYWGSVAGARFYSGRRMAAKFDAVVAGLERRLAYESEVNLDRSMPFPVRWDPFFKDVMTLADVYHYPTEHFEFHRRQLTLTRAQRQEAEMSEHYTEIRNAVREHYAKAATASECCGSTGSADDLIGRTLYGQEEAAVLPEGALAASLGCGNPTLLADLRPGEVVLDLGSGGGIDVLLSARRVAPLGKAYGLDMTPEMLELARKNQAETEVTNAEFLEGTMEAVPLPDASVDVIISNCVVNLSPDKPAVFREALRVLKPGGRLAISDIVLRRPLPEPVQEAMGLWTGCVAGALVEVVYKEQLANVGFDAIDIEPTQIYERADLARIAADLIASGGLPATLDVEVTMDELDGAVMSAFIRARKPGD
jgi:arsenite methyltransferase